MTAEISKVKMLLDFSSGNFHVHNCLICSLIFYQNKLIFETYRRIHVCTSIIITATNQSLALFSQLLMTTAAKTILLKVLLHLICDEIAFDARQFCSERGIFDNASARSERTPCEENNERRYGEYCHHTDPTSRNWKRNSIKGSVI